MNLWNELFIMRDKEREQLKTSRVVVKHKDIPWEENRQGRMRWYLHPAIKDTAIRTIMVYVQEIPPGGHSGKVRHQGGTAFFIWEGKGYTVVNGKRYDWEKYDAVMLPIISNKGVEYQHFNSDPAKPARLIAEATNIFDAVGVDMGHELEQLEEASKAK